MITQIDRSTCRLLRDKINESLKDLAEELGVNIEAGNASYTNENATVKLKVSTKNIDGTVNSKEADDFKRCASSWGLTPEDLNREFTIHGKTYKIVGANPRASRYPINAKRVSDGKGFKLAAFQVQLALK